MTRRDGPKPTSFSTDHEEDYWHSAQDIAYRAGASLIERDGVTWLIFVAHEQRIQHFDGHNGAVGDVAASVDDPHRSLPVLSCTSNRPN